MGPARFRGRGRRSMVAAVGTAAALATLATGCARSGPRSTASQSYEEVACGEAPPAVGRSGAPGATTDRAPRRPLDHDGGTSRPGPFRLPLPGGPHAIGTVTYHWTDRSRQEILTPRPGDHRELMVQVWYPAERGRVVERARYLPDAADVMTALGRVFGVPPEMLRGIGAVTTHALVEAQVAGTACYPVLVFLEGLGGFRQMNTFQVEELASHGYVVVALDQPYTAASVTFPGGRVAAMGSLDRMRPLVRQSYLPAATRPALYGRELGHGIVPHLAGDVSFALDELREIDRHDPRGILTGRLDLTRVGAFGSSLGGIVAAEAARDEPRLDALLLMDAPVPLRTVASGLDRPTMWITRSPEWMRRERAAIGGWSEEEIAAHHATMRATFERLRAPGWFVRIPRVSHLDFTDVSSWSPAFRAVGATGPMDGDRVHRILNDFSVAFFDRHLRDGPGRLLDGVSRRHPDVAVERRVPARGEGAS